jgi:cyanophycin synthetase
MKIVSMRILGAGNLFSNHSVAQMVLSEEEAQHQLPPSVAKLVVRAVPKQREETLDFSAWKLLLRVQTPFRATLLIEALALLIQRSVNIPVSFSASTEESGSKEMVSVFEVENADAGFRAGETAVRLFNKISEVGADQLREEFLKEIKSYVKGVARKIPESETLEIAKCAKRRGIPWASLPKCTYIQLGQGRHKTIMSASESSHTSSMGVRVAKKKQIANPILAAAGLPVSAQQTVEGLDDAVVSAKSIGYPVVIKPADGKKGRGVTVGIANESQVRDAVRKAQNIARRIVIESVISGEEYRLLVINGQFCAAAKRRPAHVKGDGISTVRQLIGRANQNPERQRGGHTNLYPLRMDQETLTCLAEQGLSLDAVPEPGQMALLRRVSNVSQGGDTVDVTDLVHPSVRDIAQRAASVLGLDVCGVDYITTDITCPQWEVGGAICEVNSRPGLSVHMIVSEGTPRDMADTVVDMLFPDGAPSRIPIITVLDDGKADVVQNAILSAAKERGCRIGLVSPRRNGDGMSRIHVRSSHHLDQINEIIMDGAIDAALIVVSAYDIISFGLGLDRADLAILPAEKRSADYKAAKVLTRLAEGRLIKDDDPELLDRVLEALKLPRVKRRKKSVGEPKPPRQIAKASSPIVVETQVQRDEAEFTALLLGDIGFGESYLDHPRALELRRLYALRGHRHSLLRLKHLLSAADLRIGNLEVPLAASLDQNLVGRKRYLGWSDADETILTLLEAGMDALSIANNHALDCGITGLKSTIRRLQESGIACFGAGANSTAAGKPFIKTFKIGSSERTIIVFGCFEFRKKYERQFKWYAGPNRSGVNQILPEVIAEEIKALRETVPSPFFIVYPHWGIDYLDIQQNQRDYAHELIAAGADLIIGHGAHVLQGIENVAGRLVAYGIGNFVWNTPGRYNKLNAIPYSLATAVCFRRVNGKDSVSLRLYPLLTDNGATKFQSRTISSVELPDALTALTRNFDLVGNNAVMTSDRYGAYLEIPVPGTPLQSLPAYTPAIERISGRVIEDIRSRDTVSASLLNLA